MARKAIDPKAQWNRVAEAYARREIGRDSFPYDVLGRFEKVRFLEAGSGDGDVSIFMAEQGSDAVGLDISDVFLEISNRKIAGRDLENIRFIKGDVRQMPFREQEFDLIYSCGVIEHFEETFESLAEHCRVLKDGGHILIGVPCKQGLHYPLKSLMQKIGIYDIGYEKSYAKAVFQRELERKGLTIQERYYFPMSATTNQSRIKYLLTKVASALDRRIGGTMMMFFLCRKRGETTSPDIESATSLQ
jgi:SAM-dependent methyltransferase